VHDYDFLLRALGLCGDRVVFEPSLATISYRVHASNTITEDMGRALGERERMLRSRARPLERVASAMRRAVSLRALDRTIDPAVDRPDRVPRERSLSAGLVVRNLHEGGLEQMVATLALGFPAHGVEPSILCLETGGRTADRLRRSGVPVEVARGSRRRWRRWVERVRPAVLSTHHAPLAFLDEAHRLGVPAVETVQNTYGWYSEADWREERAKAEVVAGTVVVSRVVSEYYARHVVPRIPPTMIPNGVRASGVCVVPRAFARRRLGIGPEEFVFAHVGRIDAQKNQEGLLAAFREVRRRAEAASLIVAGAGLDGALGAALRARHADLIASGAVRFEHFPTGVEVLLSAADAFVANSFFEGWSLAASEALWCGLPIVVSDVGGSREQVGEKERGCVVPNPVGDPLAVSPASIAGPDPQARTRNHEELVAGMLHVMEAFAGADRRGAIRRWARERLDAARAVEAHARLLAGVAQAGRR
jgi:glycosyltransferase involved in cell wall biosynthesis